MSMSIGEVAQKMAMSTATIRYYEEQGILPFVTRDSGGRRVFDEDAIHLLTTVQHLKNTGMSIADIRMYVAWIVAGEVTVPERLAFLENHRKKVLARIALEQESLAAVEVKESVEQLGARAIALQLNVAKQDTFADFAENIKDALTQLGTEKFDILVNNAGTSNHDKILDITPTTLDSLYEVHVKAVVFLTQVLTPLQNDGGVIINTSSGLTRLTFPGSGLYGMLKAAVETLTRYMAVEFADRKIRVNVVAPGPIATSFSGLDDNVEQQGVLADYAALGRIGQPEDVAKVTVALAMESGEFVTAQRVEVSGGIAL